MIEFKDAIILAWNVRGETSATSKRHLREVVRSKQPSLVFMFETHVAFQKVCAFWNSFGYYMIHIVEAQGHSGGI